MTLLFLLFLLVAPYLIITVLGRWIVGLRMAPSKRARVGLSLFFVITASQHVLSTEQRAAMIPPSIPYPRELTYITGVFELLGPIGVWIPRIVRLTGLLLIVMLIGILPAHIYSAFN